MSDATNEQNRKGAKDRLVWTEGQITIVKKGEKTFGGPGSGRYPAGSDVVKGTSIIKDAKVTERTDT